MRVSVLVPFRGDGGHRDRVWDYVKPLWEELPVELVVGEDPGDQPFNVSRAFNDAASRATGDLFVLFGADQLPDVDRVAWAMREAQDGAKWCPLFAATGAYSEGDTRLLVENNADPSRFDFAQWAPFCTGIFAVTRAGWAEINGMDERFFGWGCEDTAVRMALEVVLGPAPEPAGTLHCLWHPAASRSRFDANAAMIGAYETAAAAGPEAMRALVAGNRP
jgi:hypothetical protein